MKKLALVLAVAFIGTIIFTGMVFAQDKLAYIDLSRAFSEYNKTKDYDKKLTDKENSYITERDKRVGEFNTLKDKFALLSEAEKDKKKGELENKAKSLRDFITQREEELRKDQEERMKEILKDIQDAVKAHSEKSGITIVFNDRVLVYQNKTMDITDSVIAILNKKR
ncbi:MAG: OmpH family outer membrane protein [Candidatus Omnitrophica bacterium]|nr:OmpH family outer membrane protein [Candidatus Omnitrophota bacterium]